MHRRARKQNPTGETSTVLVRLENDATEGDSYRSVRLSRYFSWFDVGFTSTMAEMTCTSACSILLTCGEGLPCLDRQLL